MQHRFDDIMKGLFPGGGTVLLAVSGGMDSMCLATLFHSSASAPSFAVANCNFNLRGEESDGDSAMVRQWCGERGIVCHTASFPTGEYAAVKGYSVEMAARELRYGWFDRLCREHGYAALAVAHNSNDNAETMILNLLRGTGVRGMAGMRPESVLPCPSSRVPLLRPLLSFSREEISAFVSENGVPYRNDSSNFGNEYRRNKVRNLIFPLFREINPSFLDSFARDMANLSQLSAFADSCFGEIRPSLVSFENEDQLRISVGELRRQAHPEYLTYRLLEPYGFSPADISSLVRLLTRESDYSGRQFFSGEWRLVTSSSELVVSRKRALVMKGLSPCADVTVVRSAGIYSTAGVSYSVELRKWDSGAKVPAEAGLTLADASVLGFPFIVRGWRKGDWMRPLGLHGRKKLSDMFVDLKMSLHDKERALVAISPAAAGQEGRERVMSLLGRRIDESVRVGEATESVVLVRILS